MSAADTLHALRRTLFAAAAMTAAGLSIWAGAQLMRAHAAAVEADLHALHQAAHRQLDEARHAAAEHQRIQAALAQRYPQADGGAGPIWPVALEHLRTRHAPFAFDLRPRHNTASPATGLQVAAHTLHLAVLHEGRLNALLAELPQAGTRTILRGCRLHRSADTNAPAAPPRLSAECDLDRLTLPADALPPQ